MGAKKPEQKSDWFCKACPSGRGDGRYVNFASRLSCRVCELPKSRCFGGHAGSWGNDPSYSKVHGQKAGAGAKGGGKGGDGDKRGVEKKLADLQASYDALVAKSGAGGAGDCDAAPDADAAGLAAEGKEEAKRLSADIDQWREAVNTYKRMEGGLTANPQALAHAESQLDALVRLRRETKPTSIRIRDAQGCADRRERAFKQATDALAKTDSQIKLLTTEREAQQKALETATTQRDEARSELNAILASQANSKQADEEEEQSPFLSIGKQLAGIEKSGSLVADPDSEAAKVWATCLLTLRTCLGRLEGEAPAKAAAAGEVAAAMGGASSTEGGKEPGAVGAEPDLVMGDADLEALASAIDGDFPEDDSDVKDVSEEARKQRASARAKATAYRSAKGRVIHLTMGKSPPKQRVGGAGHAPAAAAKKQDDDENL